MPYEPIEEGDFSGGLNLNEGAQDLRTNEFVQLLNLFPYGDDGRATLKYAGGNRPILSTGAAVQGFIRFKTATDSFFVYAVGGSVFAFNESTLTTATIYTGGHATNLFEFAVLSVFGHDRVFWVDGSSAVKQWYGTGTAESVGIAAPATAPNLANGGAGNLDTTGLAPIQYAVTFGDSTKGVESNPSPFSVGINVTLSKIDLSAIPVSGDARVDTRYIYRFGANLEEWTLVKTISDNVTTTYTDNLPDNQTGTIQLSFSRDLPPVGCSIITDFDHRIWLAGGPFPFTLFYSTESAPDYFPQGVITFPLTDGGTKNIDGDRTNTIVGFCLSGANLTVCRRKGIHWVVGDNGDNYSFPAMTNPGAVSRRSIVQCGYLAVWQALDGNVYALTPSGKKMLSASIRKYMEAIPKSKLPTSCACFWHDKYVICIGNGDGSQPICLAYDFPTESWVNLSHHTRAARQLYSESGEGDSDEMYLSTETGYTDANNAAYNGIVATCTVDVTYLPVQITSGLRDYGAKGGRIRVHGSRLWGSWTPKPATAPTVTYTITSGDSTVSKQYPLGFTNGILFDRTLPRSLAGNHLQWQVDGIIGSGDFYSAEFDVELMKQKGRRRL